MTRLNLSCAIVFTLSYILTTAYDRVCMILCSSLCLVFNIILWSCNYDLQNILYSKIQKLNFEKLRWAHWWRAPLHGRVLCTHVNKISRLMNSLCLAWIYNFSYILFALWTASSFICDRLHVVLYSNYNIWSCIYYFIFDLMFSLQYYCLILQL